MKDEGADASPAEVDEVDVSDLDAVEAKSLEDAPADEPTKESEAESPTAEEEDLDEKTEVDPKKEVQDRINKLTGNWRETQRELQAREDELAELRRQLADTPKQREPVKTLADFEYDEGKYQSYLFDEAEKRAEDAATRVATKIGSETEKQRHYAKFLARESKFEESVKDYRTAVAPDKWACSPVMAEEIWQSDMGPELTYHLAKNPDIAMEISQLPERAAVRKIALLETDLRSEKAKIKSNKVSGAPAPVPKISGGNAGIKVSTTDPKSDDMSDAEWFKAEEKRLAKLRG